MLKVSLTNTKVQRFNDKVTIVTITGKMPLKFESCVSWFILPKEMEKWIKSLTSIDLTENWATNEMIIKVQGKAVRTDEDSYDEVLGERIAESRAKLSLFRFLSTLLDKIITAYEKQLYGKTMPWRCESGDKNCLYASRHKYIKARMTELMHLNKLLDEANK